MSATDTVKAAMADETTTEKKSSQYWLNVRVNGQVVGGIALDKINSRIAAAIRLHIDKGNTSFSKAKVEVDLLKVLSEKERNKAIEDLEAQL